MIRKALSFAALVPKSPAEALERLSAVAESRWDAYRSPHTPYKSCSLTEALRIAGKAIHANLFDFLTEPELSGLQGSIETNWRSLRLAGPFRTEHNGDIGLARFCYCLTRAICPQTIVETGVCYGVTSSFILQALQCNRKGHLHSIDLPPLDSDGDRFVGQLIPENLRNRWTLYRGTSRRLLAPLLKRVGRIDLFLHDSLHTHRNMKMEMSFAWHALRPGGVLLADDVEANRAFQELSESAPAARSLVFAEKEKKALCGLMVKPS